MWEKYNSLLNDIIVTKWFHSLRFDPGYVLDTLVLTYQRIANQTEKTGRKPLAPPYVFTNSM